MFERIPESQQVMDQNPSVDAYEEGGKKGNLLPTYWLATGIICNLAPKRGQALDIACGNGLLTLALAESLPDIKFQGLELSLTMLEKAKLNLKYRSHLTNRVEFKEGNMRDLSALPSHSSDVTLLTYALHHTDTEDEALHILSEIRRITKQEGAIFIMDLIRPRSERVYTFSSKAFGTKNPYLQKDFEASLKASYRPEEFRRLLERAGLGAMTYHRDIVLQMAYRPHHQAVKHAPILFNLDESTPKAKFIYQTSKVIFNWKNNLARSWIRV